jgi:hypothetical protein
MVNHQGNFLGAVIKATLALTGGGSTSTSVSGVNIQN